MWWTYVWDTVALWIGRSAILLMLFVMTLAVVANMPRE
jgi:hypothetical protein